MSSPQLLTCMCSGSVAQRLTHELAVCRAPALPPTRRCFGRARVRTRVHAAMMDRSQMEQAAAQMSLAAKTSSQVQLTGVQIEERAMMKCIEKHQRFLDGANAPSSWTYPADKLEEAYERCGIITEDFAKTFYLGTQLMAPEKARAVWAIYVWCRRTDELVDGPNADRITPQVRTSVCRHYLTETLQQSG